MSRPTTSIFTTLIRTHHITSRKKVQRLRKAAAICGVHLVIIRSGGSPGLMYAESPEEASISGWVAAVQALRYKDFQCVHKPATHSVVHVSDPGGFREVESTTEFAKEMELRGLAGWWRRGMGYENET